MRKEDKELIIAQLGEVLKTYPHFYLVDVTGMDAARTSAMRRQCFKSEVKMVVVKNTLLHKAFEASEIDYSPLYETLKGTTAVIFSQVANAPAKMLKEFNSKNPKGVTIPELKAAYAEESRPAGCPRCHQEQERSHRRDCGYAAVPHAGPRFCTRVWSQHHPRCPRDPRREGRIIINYSKSNKQNHIYYYGRYQSNR